MFYAASTNLIKAAIAVTLLRLTDQPKYRWPITASLVATPIFTGAVVIVLIVTCRPVGAQWDLDLGPCPLHNWLAILSYPFTALTIILDWGCAIIPWLLIRKLQLNRRIKRSLIIVLGLGGTASIGAIARLPYLKYYTIPEDQLCKFNSPTRPRRLITRGGFHTDANSRSHGQHSRLVSLRKWRGDYSSVSATYTQALQILRRHLGGV